MPGTAVCPSEVFQQNTGAQTAAQALRKKADARILFVVLLFLHSFELDAIMSVIIIMILLAQVED